MTEKTHKSPGLKIILPDVLPVFPFAGVILLPRARLPLNILEPRYVAMIESALGQGRIIGLIQPTVSEEQNPVPSLYQVGCAGKITSFSETDDGRFLISLQGICRFRVKEEISQQREHRRVVPDWSEFEADMGPPEDGEFDRGRLLAVLRQYFKTYGIAADWNAVHSTSDEALIASLTMICPLEPNEKQALLEADNLKTRAETLITLLEMASLPQLETEGARH
ncbi:MAG: LON peptidase substrate-binding domain-containing protein [Alphaproteobacteria bacterium]|nr:LON peptidase substrate-binding domain-containing protein [Alphaproteobacteria bacterium]